MKLSPTSWLTTKTVFSQVFALALFAIQAPLLGPRAFGLISIVMVFVGFCEYVPVEAAADSLISIRKIDERHFSTMTTANVGLSLLIGVIVFLGAATIARWFHDPEVAGMLRWMAILPTISAFAAAPTAATKRDMQFGPLAVRSIGSVVAGGLVGLVLTLTGAGVWALVFQALVTRLVATVVLWYAVPLKFSMRFSAVHFRDLLQFAFPTMVSRFLTWSSQQIPRVLLGLYWGSTELGLFSLAARLGDILMDVAVVPRYAVARVELRKHANEHPALEAALERILMISAVFCFPLCVGGAAVVPTLFRVWLDPRWAGAVVPAQVMLLACGALVTQYMGNAVLLALNLQRSEALVSIAQTLATVIAVTVCAPFGILATSVAIAARPYLLTPLSLWLLGRRCGIAPAVVFRPQLPALLASGVMGVCVWLSRLALSGVVAEVVALPLLVVIGAIVYGVMVKTTMPEVVAQFINRPRLPGRA
jgi:O-antigen/teichoic acid export membrane protein